LLQLPTVQKIDLRWNRHLSLPSWIDQLTAKGCLIYY
jgi:hypothetical protein